MQRANEALLGVAPEPQQPEPPPPQQEVDDALHASTLLPAAAEAGVADVQRNSSKYMYREAGGSWSEDVSAGKWLRAARLSQFADGCTAVMAGDEWGAHKLPPVALFRLRSGADAPVYAIQDACPHVAIGSLVKGDAAYVGDIEDWSGSTCRAAVACPVHAFTFDLDNGLCIAGPSTQV
jgi:nitrite reductase/ring-hydroxylating ferredoxin subunit